jgi:hypothetical protein
VHAVDVDNQGVEVGKQRWGLFHLHKQDFRRKISISPHLETTEGRGEIEASDAVKSPIGGECFEWWRRTFQARQQIFRREVGVAERYGEVFNCGEWTL